ncbi:hypothetical protein ACSQ67_012803 [Phaseolus vulgaris]
MTSLLKLMTVSAIARRKNFTFYNFNGGLNIGYVPVGIICSVQGHVHVLLQYHKCAVSEDYFTMDSASDSSSKESPHFSDNHYCKALEHAIDTDLDWSILKKIVPM